MQNTEKMIGETSGSGQVKGTKALKFAIVTNIQTVCGSS